MKEHTATATAAEKPIMEQPPAALAEYTAPTAKLPDGYLEGGYHATTDKGATYLKPDYVDGYAKGIAAQLAMKPNDFAALLRGLKSAKKRTLPFEARQTATAEMLPKSLALVRRKKAAPLLVDFVKANLQAIHTDDDFSAFYRHCEAINGYLTLASDK